MAESNNISSDLINIDSLKDKLQHLYPKYYEEAKIKILGKANKYGLTTCIGIGAYNSPTKQLFFQGEIIRSRISSYKGTNHKLELDVKVGKDFVICLCSLLKSIDHINSIMDDSIFKTKKIKDFNILPIKQILTTPLSNTNDSFEISIRIALNGFNTNVFMSSELKAKNFKLRDWNEQKLYYNQTKDGVNSQYVCSYFPTGNPFVNFQLNMIKIIDDYFELNYRFTDYNLIKEPSLTFMVNGTEHKMLSVNDEDEDDEEEVVPTNIIQSLAHGSQESKKKIESKPEVIRVAKASLDDIIKKPKSSTKQKIYEESSEAESEEEYIAPPKSTSSKSSKATKSSNRH